MPKMNDMQEELEESDCCGSHEPDDDEEDPSFFGNSNPSNSDTGSFKTKAITFMMIFPMLATGVIMLSDAVGKYNFNKTAMQITATIGGAGLALYIMFKIPQLREAVKFILCFAWLLLLLPTYQVYSCNPVELKNSMLGTWFKLATTHNDFLEKSYETSECFKSHKLQAPYKLSILSAKVSLVVQISDLINLEGRNDEVEKDEQPSYFLTISKRSVKKKFHKIYLIVEAFGKEAKMLAKSLKFDGKEKDENLLVITGSVMTLGDELLPMKKELEQMHYLVRPIKFKLDKVTYRDKYAKFKAMPDENLY